MFLFYLICRVFVKRYLGGSPSQKSEHTCSIPAGKYIVLGLSVILYHVPLVCMVTFYTKLIIHIKNTSVSWNENAENDELENKKGRYFDKNNAKVSRSNNNEIKNSFSKSMADNHLKVRVVYIL